MSRDAKPLSVASSGVPLRAEAPDTLLHRLRARDEQALVELIDLATPWLLGLTLSMLSDRGEAEEVVFEVFATAWDRIYLMDEEKGGLMPWLMRITRNRALDRLRAGRRRTHRVERAEAFGALGAHVTAAVEPDEAAHPGWHVHESVHRALAALPEEQRAAIQLAYFQGLTHSEIAEHLGIPMGTVKTRLRLAFDKLRATLAPIGDWVT